MGQTPAADSLSFAVLTSSVLLRSEKRDWWLRTHQVVKGAYQRTLPLGSRRAEASTSTFVAGHLLFMELYSLFYILTTLYLYQRGFV